MSFTFSLLGPRRLAVDSTEEQKSHHQERRISVAHSSTVLRMVRENVGIRPRMESLLTGISDAASAPAASANKTFILNNLNGPASVQFRSIATKSFLQRCVRQTVRSTEHLSEWKETYLLPCTRVLHPRPAALHELPNQGAAKLTETSRARMVVTSVSKRSQVRSDAKAAQSCVLQPRLDSTQDRTWAARVARWRV